MLLIVARLLVADCWSLVEVLNVVVGDGAVEVNKGASRERESSPAGTTEYVSG